MNRLTCRPQSEPGASRSGQDTGPQRI